jgi:predicted ArsR family transcriptional regulator
MPTTEWDRRFFASTRGQVVTLLRRGERTVDELAHALALTDNAVRAHLAALERDGLVRQRGVRRGGGKPAHAYGLAPEAERLFPKADALALRGVLDVLAERLPAPAFDDLVREAGRRLAASAPAPAGDLRARVEQAAALLADLGGLAEWEERDGGFEIRGFSCPLAAASPGCPAVCRLAAALLSDVVGAPVQERCEAGEPGGPPHCRFDIAAQAADLA